MRNRREFITTATGAAVGMLASGSGLLDARAALRQVGAKPGKRREVTIGGRRVKTVDLHAHCFVPEVMDSSRTRRSRRRRRATSGSRPLPSATRSV